MKVSHGLLRALAYKRALRTQFRILLPPAREWIKESCLLLKGLNTKLVEDHWVGVVRRCHAVARECNALGAIALFYSVKAGSKFLEG